ncbi:hypothetical protein LGK97_01700 [Clostridium sp. CS001]|uniref:hypothetical protein n=1 Tax=Clostridium sp. CS001 TaxID=2880648 RepID=UPI001CF54AA4|nr:hypothetical protein [Clostridium sp. CS001]MCB2288482.1 hypothetical protein [Clostridium sp. CS001]
MLTKFQRPEKCAKHGRVLGEYIIKMEEVLDKLSIGTANLEKVKEFISSLIKEQDEKGFFALIPSPEVPSDIRVLYWYEPTYIGAAIMMKFYMQHKNECSTIEGFDNALKMALVASTGRGLKGHGHDDIKGRLSALQIFSKGEVMEFVRNYPEMSPEFSRMIGDITTWLEDAVMIDKTKIIKP